MEAPPPEAARTLWQCHKRRKEALEASLPRTEAVIYLTFILPVFSNACIVLSCPPRFQSLYGIFYVWLFWGHCIYRIISIHFGSVTIHPGTIC